MKILDKYILKSFLAPFLATFLIVLFVFVMQALWLAFDDIAGKGISLLFILKFIGYTTLLVIPQALPVGVLLSSIMALGNFSENYEFAASKSAGVSLQRLIKPLIALTLLMSVVNFFFLNNVYPYAMLKQKNLLNNIKTKEPTLALVAGSFNTEIPNYHIKFDEKYGEDNNLLKKVMIYDLSSRKGLQKIITAQHGKIISKEGSRYMTLVLSDGHFFQSHIKNGATFKQRLKMPASTADFEEYTINIDISSFSDGDLDDEKYTKNFNMLSLQQLKDTLPSLKQNYDEFVGLRAKRIFENLEGASLYKIPDSLRAKKLQPRLLDNFDTSSKLKITTNALGKANTILRSSIKANKKSLKYKRKRLNLYDVEFYNRIAFSFSCLILFFIGAPLGSIIRKGGMGLPMILAIAIYVLYFFTNTFGKNLAEESTVTALLGSWISAILMVPIAILLTRRATRDKGLFNLDAFTQPLINLFKKRPLKRQ